MLRRSENLFVARLDPDIAGIIEQVITAIDKSNFDKARELLKPLVENHNAAALFYAASFGRPEETQAAFEKRHIEQLHESAKLGYVPAIHELAIRYDSGDMVALDAKKAAQLFKQAAQKDHPHSQWIHGEDLLYGRNGIEKDEKLGIEYIKKAAAAKFEGALEAVAGFYEQGIFGFQKDTEKANTIKQQITNGNVIGY